jgi:hypothetical protein
MNDATSGTTRTPPPFPLRRLRSLALGEARSLSWGSEKGVRLSSLKKEGGLPVSSGLLILVMTMLQRSSRIIGDEIDLHGAVARHVDRIRHHPRGRLVAVTSIAGPNGDAQLYES